MQIKFFQKQKVFKKEDYSIYPRKFWKIILYVSFSMIILSFVFGALMFFKVNKLAQKPCKNILKYNIFTF